MEHTVVVQVKPGKSIGIRGIQIEYLGKTQVPDWLILNGAGKVGQDHGDIVRVPASFYEANRNFLDLVALEAPPAAPEVTPKPGKKAAPVREPQPAVAAEADPTEGQDDKNATLEAMTYQQLKDMAKEAGITWTKVPARAWLIAELMKQG